VVGILLVFAVQNMKNTWERGIYDVRCSTMKTRKDEWPSFVDVGKGDIRGLCSLSQVVTGDEVPPWTTPWCRCIPQLSWLEMCLHWLAVTSPRELLDRLRMGYREFVGFGLERVVLSSMRRERE
jgi:hypothetical protein